MSTPNISWSSPPRTDSHSQLSRAALTSPPNYVAIPRKDKPGKTRQAAERRRAFRRAVKWRTGSEGRISTLKRQYGWDHTRLDSIHGARPWAGYGVLAHNLIKISALAT
jgi:transposase, IS5 family